MSFNMECSTTDGPATFTEALLCYTAPLSLLSIVFLAFRSKVRSKGTVNEDYSRFMNEPILVTFLWPAFFLNALCGLYALIECQLTEQMWFLYGGSNLVMGIFHFYHLLNLPYTYLLAWTTYPGYTVLLNFLMVEVSYCSDETSKQLLLNLFGCLEGWSLSWSIYISFLYLCGVVNLHPLLAGLLAIMGGTGLLYLLVQNLKLDHVLWSELIGIIAITVIGMFVIGFISLMFWGMKTRKRRPEKI